MRTRIALTLFCFMFLRSWAFVPDILVVGTLWLTVAAWRVAIYG